MIRRHLKGRLSALQESLSIFVPGLFGKRQSDSFGSRCSDDPFRYDLHVPVGRWTHTAADKDGWLTAIRVAARGCV